MTPLEKITEAYDRKSRLYDILNKDYIKLRDRNKLLEETLRIAIADYDRRKITAGWHDLQIKMFKKVLSDTQN